MTSRQPILYDVAALTVFSPSRTSSFVRTISLAPETFAVKPTVTRSSHPHLRGRPVVVPNSRPASRSLSPVSPFSSVPKNTRYLKYLPKVISISISLPAYNR